MKDTNVIGLAYKAAEEAERTGDAERAAGFESIGRMWYLIEKWKLGVELNDSEKGEVNEFVAKHGPKA